MKQIIRNKQIGETVNSVVEHYPDNLRWIPDANHTRILWQIAEVIHNAPEGGTILDLV